MADSGERLRLLFVSTLFLHPVDTGARIRTTQVLRGLRGGRFHVTLASPATARELALHRAAMDDLADEYHHWPARERGRLFALLRLRHLFAPLPVPVMSDRSRAGRARVRDLLAARPDLVVADFPHAMVLLPERLAAPLVIFTHNVEAEIFARHHDVSGDPLRRWIWNTQRDRMARYEQAVLRRASAVVAVSDRDADAFSTRYGIGQVTVIPTGVDLDHYGWRPPGTCRQIVFTGSMDWLANIDGIGFLLREVWPLVVARAPDARMVVVGRSPPPALIDEARRRGYAWEFTGRVPDTRPYVYDSAGFVIPLRVGGGTRLKVYEAMAMGCPVVSTRLGVEGLPVAHDRHCLLGDTPAELADYILRLLEEPPLRQRLSQAARAHVEENFSYRQAAAVFEQACARALGRG